MPVSQQLFQLRFSSSAVGMAWSFFRIGAYALNSHATICGSGHACEKNLSKTIKAHSLLQ